MRAEENGIEDCSIEPGVACRHHSDWSNLSPLANWQVQVLQQMADGGMPEEEASMSASPGLEVMAILKESADRLNMFSSQLQLRNERDDAHRIAQVYYIPPNHHAQERCPRAR